MLNLMVPLNTVILGVSFQETEIPNGRLGAYAFELNYTPWTKRCAVTSSPPCPERC